MATILYVDDEPAVGLMLEDTLEHAGHQAVGARNVPDALQRLACGNVDLIISDYRMPGLTGLEFLALLRREGYDTPLIMLTGYASIEHAVAAIKAGAVDYITKPVRPEQLQLAIDHALELVRLRRKHESMAGPALDAPAHAAVTLTSFNVDAAEAVLIRHALEVAGYNRTRAAELLGISVRTLRNKLNGPAREDEG